MQQKRLQVLGNGEPVIADLHRIFRQVDLSKPALLIQPPIIAAKDIQAEVVRARGYFSYPPYGLLRLAAVLKVGGIESVIVDLNNIGLRAVSEGENPLTAIRQALYGHVDRVSFVCLTHMFEANVQEVLAIAKSVRELFRNIPICAGGIAATANPKVVLEDANIDCVVGGEAESSVDSLVAFMRGDTDDLPPNLSYFKEGVVVATTKNREQRLVTDVREQYTKLRLADYATVGTPSTFYKLRGHTGNFATILTKTGCRAHCSFCGVREFNGKGVRVRTTGDVIDEMVHLYHTQQVRHFELLDDDFLYDTEAVVRLLKAMAERFSDVTWSANNGLIAAALTEEVITLMEKSRCIGFKIGLESGDPAILKRLHKPTNISGYVKVCEALRKYPSIFVSTNIILGIPGEDFSSMTRSLALSLASPTCWTNYYNYQNLPGTELFHDQEDIASLRAKLGQEITINMGSQDTRSPFNPYARSPKAKVSTLSGYEVFKLPDDHVPTPQELKEIWFTFNIISNYLCNPVLDKLNCKEAVTNTVRWLIALSEAFPDNPVSLCLLHYLLPYTDEQQDTNGILNKARCLISASEYWQQRDVQFHFSDFLSGKIPDLDSIVKTRIMDFEQ